MLKRVLTIVIFVSVYFLSTGTSIAGIDTLPSKGNLKALAVFVKFPGESLTSPPSYSKDIFNIDIPGSFSHFYNEMSCGQLRVEGEVLPKLYVTNHPASYYIDRYDRKQDKMPPYGQVVAEILEKVDSDIDFSKFDSDGPDGIPNSGDDDGYVDVVFMNFFRIPSGFIPIGEARGIAELGLGGAGFVSSDTGISGSNIGVKSGSVQEFLNFPRLVGVMCHEFGHLMGLGDLYNKGQKNPPENDSAGIGLWGIMSWGASHGWNGNDDTPVPFCEYSLEKLGWIGPDNERLKVVTQSGRILVSPLFQDGEVYKVPLSDREYFLISNRDPSASYYDRNIHGSGLLIWHVTEKYGHEAWSIDLECADGKYIDAGYPFGKETDPVNGGDNLDFWASDEDYKASHSGNLGDSTDLFDGEKFTSFSEDTNPSSRWEGSDRYPSWELSASNISIGEIRRENGAISAAVTIPQKVELFDYVIERYEETSEGWVPTHGPAGPSDKLCFRFRLKNWMDLTLSSLTAIISTDDPFVNPGDGFQPVSLNFSEILPGGIAGTNLKQRELTKFTVASDVPPGHDIQFHFSMNSDRFEWKDSLVVQIEGADTTSLSIRTAVEEDKDDLAITKYALMQNYPNPFNATTQIEYYLPGDEHVKLTVYDILGRKVADLVDEVQTSGYHTVVWNARDLASGNYIYRIEAGGFTQTMRGCLLK